MLLLGCFFYVIAVMQQDIVPMYKMWQKISFFNAMKHHNAPQKKNINNFRTSVISFKNGVIFLF